MNSGVGAGINQALNTSTDQQLQDWSQKEAQKLYDSTPGPTEQDILAADPSIPLPPSGGLPAPKNVPGYYDEITGEYIPSNIGQLQSVLDETSGANLESMGGYQYDPETNKWTLPTGEVIDTSYLSNSREPYDTSMLDQAQTEAGSFDPQKQVNYSAVVRAMLDEQKRQEARAQSQQKRALSYAFNPFCTSIPWLDTKAQMLEGKSTTEDSTETSPVGVRGGLAGAKPIGGEESWVEPQHQMRSWYRT